MIKESVFNSSLEAGMRAIAFLDTYHPKSLDFEQLMKVDYILVNSADFGGPASFILKYQIDKESLAHVEKSCELALS